MKNYEKYANEIKEYNGFNFCRDFVKPHILKSRGCANTSCDQCKMLQTIWLMEEYEDPKEPEIDWSKVEVDTPILVRQGKNGTWLERHFAKYENGDVYAWVDGQTSWTGADKVKWKFAKLAEDEKECKELEVDWSKVEVDTPILVRYSEKGMWIRRKFAKFEDGVVYAWHGKEAGQSKSYMTPWNYAKLAESEE